MRKSSKGNPYHVPAGSPKGGQFTTKNNGIAIIRNRAYYDVRTQLRKGEISETAFQKIVKAQDKPSEIPVYDALINKLNTVNVSTEDDKRILFNKIVEAAGVKCNVPIRMTRGKCRTGSCKVRIYDNGDGVHKEVVSVSLSSEYDESEQIKTLYHEAYHFVQTKD